MLDLNTIVSPKEKENVFEATTPSGVSIYETVGRRPTQQDALITTPLPELSTLTEPQKKVAIRRAFVGLQKGLQPFGRTPEQQERVVQLVAKHKELLTKYDPLYRKVQTLEEELGRRRKMLEHPFEANRYFFRYETDTFYKNQGEIEHDIRRLEDRLSEQKAALDQEIAKISPDSAEIIAELNELRKTVTSGSTAIVCAITGTQVITAGLGDSTAHVVIRNGDGSVRECRRLNRVLHQDTERTNELLQSFNADGADNEHLVIPDIAIDNITIPAGCTAFVVIACDGLTEEAKGKDDSVYLRGMLEEHKSVSTKDLPKTLANQAITDGSGDNISVMVVPLNSASIETNLHVVCDGVGGGDGGEIVSQYLVDNIKGSLVEAAAQQAPTGDEAKKHAFYDKWDNLIQNIVPRILEKIKDPEEQKKFMKLLQTLKAQLMLEKDLDKKEALLKEIENKFKLFLANLPDVTIQSIRRENLLPVEPAPPAKPNKSSVEIITNIPTKIGDIVDPKENPDPKTGKYFTFIDDKSRKAYEAAGFKCEWKDNNKKTNCLILTDPKNDQLKIEVHPRHLSVSTPKEGLSEETKASLMRMANAVMAAMNAAGKAKNVWVESDNPAAENFLKMYYAQNKFQIKSKPQNVDNAKTNTTAPVGRENTDPQPPPSTAPRMGG